MKVLPLHYSGLVVINQRFPQAAKCTLCRMCWRLWYSPAPAGPCPALHWCFCLLLSFKPSESLESSSRWGERHRDELCSMGRRLQHPLEEFLETEAFMWEPEPEDHTKFPTCCRGTSRIILSSWVPSSLNDPVNSWGAFLGNSPTVWERGFWLE